VEKTNFIIRGWIALFLEMLFPSRCIGCNIKGEILCPNCVDRLQLAERPTEENIMAVYDYRDPIVKKAIWKLKYYKNPYLGERLGQLLYESLMEEINEIKIWSEGSPIYIIPVPVSRNKRKLRGYNQSEIIARSFCKMSESNIFQIKNNIVFKKLNTIPQARLTNRNKRLQNIKGSFEIKNKELVRGKTIIIIDDVTTTGGTIIEIMKILKKAGAKKVLGFAVAH
jgi:ComF family protein